MCDHDNVQLTPIAGDAVAGPHEDALAAWRRGDYATAYRLWGPIADQGAPDAQFYLGFMNEYGQGVPRNSVEAIKWLSQSRCRAVQSRNHRHLEQ